MVVLNQEVRFPIYRWVRGVGFADTGNVFETASATDLGKLVRLAKGAGEDCKRLSQRTPACYSSSTDDTEICSLFPVRITVRPAMPLAC